MSADNDADLQERREENDELQDQEQFEKSEEFVTQGFEYGDPLDDNPQHAYSEGHPEDDAMAAVERGNDDTAAGARPEKTQSHRKPARSPSGTPP